MAKVTDLRVLTRPSMITILPDKESTTVHVTSPTVDMVEELQEGKAVLFSVLNGAAVNEQTKRAVYNLAAKFLSCNMDGLKFTGEDLLFRYGMTPEALGVFFADYVDFLTQIENEKN